MARNKNNNYKRKPKIERDNLQDRFAKSMEKKGAKFCDKPDASKIRAYNDATWYAKNPKLLRDTASFSYNSALGAPFRLDRVYNMAEYLPPVPGYYSGYTASVPGVMVITVNPTPGVASDAQSPVNVAAQNIYSQVRYKNSGAANYNPPDLMLYLIAMDSVYSCWNWLKRIYGYASKYNQLNRYEPIAYAYADHVDFQDLMAHLSDYRAAINALAAKITSFCVPATMSYNVRHSWMYSNIYKDSDTAKAQQYMFTPGMFYQYSETSTPNGGILEVVNVNNNFDGVRKVSEIISILTTMINRLSYSEDIGNMSGDILKEYGQGGLFTLSAIDPDYMITPVYNMEVLSQIHNLTVTQIEAADYSTMNIVQNPDENWLTYSPKLSTWGGIPTVGTLINMYKDEITPEDTIVATRLTSVVSGNNTDGYSFVTVGSEFVSHLNIVYWATTQAFGTSPTYKDMQLFSIDAFTMQQLDFTLGSVNYELITRLLMTSQFDWHPLVSVVVSHREAAGEDVDRYILMGLLGDINMYTIISDENLTMMNQVALLSEFDVPADGGTF